MIKRPQVSPTLGVQIIHAIAMRCGSGILLKQANAKDSLTEKISKNKHIPYIAPWKHRDVMHEKKVEWNQHLTFSAFRMFMYRFRHQYFPNRSRYSKHIELMRKFEFRILTDEKVFTPSKLKPEELQPRFRKISNEDLTVSGAFIQCLKSPETSYEERK